MIYFETKCVAGANEVLALPDLTHGEKFNITLTEVNRSKLTDKKDAYLQWTTLEGTLYAETNAMK